MKLIFLIASFLLWIYVMAEVDPIIIKDIKNADVKILNEYILDEKNMVIDPATDRTVSVILRGRRSSIKDLDKKNLSVVGKLSDVKEGENHVDLYIPNVGNSISYTIMPNILPVDVQKNIIIEKDIQLENKNEIKSKYGVYNTVINPNSTSIEGPRKYVNKVDRLVCKVDTTNKNAPDKIRCKIVPIDSSGNVVPYVILEDQYATVQLFKKKTKTVPIKLNVKQSDKPGVSIQPQYSQITISGDEKDIQNINEIQTQEIDLNNINESSQLNVGLKIPQNIKADKTFVPIKIDVNKKITKDFVFSKNSIQFKNNIQNLEIYNNDLPEQINVSITMAKELESQITDEDILLYVDLQDEPVEDAKYKIRYEIPYEVDNVEIKPNLVGFE